MTEWLADATNAEKLARGIVKSFFVPAAYKPDGNRENGLDVAVANATAAILLGASLGFDPMTALQSIYIVHGRPGVFARAKIAVALAAGHEIWEEEYSPERAIVCGRRRGSDKTTRIVVTIADAERAGWTSNATYAKTPADMLYARAASRVVDRVCPELLMGLASVEEIEPEPARVTVVEATPVRAVSLAELEPSAAPATATVVTVDDSIMTGEIQASTWSAINARFRDLGINGDGSRLRRLAVITAIIGRNIGRGSEMTEAEGRMVIDNLAGEHGQAVATLHQDGLSDASTVPRTRGGDPGGSEDADPWAMDGAETAGEGR
jgi:hypothetical protein